MLRDLGGGVAGGERLEGTFALALPPPALLEVCLPDIVDHRVTNAKFFPVSINTVAAQWARAQVLEHRGTRSPVRGNPFTS